MDIVKFQLAAYLKNSIATLSGNEVSNVKDTEVEYIDEDNLSCTIRVKRAGFDDRVFDFLLRERYGSKNKAA